MTIDLRGSRKYIALGIVLLLVMGITLAASFSPSKASNSTDGRPETEDGSAEFAKRGKSSVTRGETSEERESEDGRPVTEDGSTSVPRPPSSVTSPPPLGLPFDPGDEPVYVTCRFRDPTASQHSGLDFPLDAFTEILSTMTGTVTFAGYDEIYGNLVIVTNAQWETRYAHNAYILTRAGDPVWPGDLLALSGSTGASSGDHLHYEIRDALDAARDPEDFLGDDLELHFSTCNEENEVSK